MANIFYGITDTGKLRDNNEDTFIAEVGANKMIIGAVIDGVGGYSGGEIAAKIAKDTLLESLMQESKDPVISLLKGIKLSNTKIYEERIHVKEHDKMACVLTVALADITNNTFYYAHVGDTRLYLFRDGRLIKVTQDHSVVGFLEETGRLSEEEAMRHPKRNEINKALGFEVHKSDEANFIDSGSSPFLPGDTLLLCSDGLTDMITHSSISSILSQEKNVEQKAKELIDAANNAGGKDNITVVLIQNNKLPTEHIAIKPESVIKDIPQSFSKQEITVKPLEKEVAEIKVKGRNSLKIMSLSVILLITILLILYNRSSKNNFSPVVVSEKKNFIQKALQDSLSFSKSKTINVNKGADPLYISDSLFINRDSVHIAGNGIVLVSDSLYKGAAFVIGPLVKYVLFDSLTFENFNTGIYVKQKGLHLKNVQFEHCIVPIRYQYLNNTDSIKETDSKSIIMDTSISK